MIITEDGNTFVSDISGVERVTAAQVWQLETISVSTFQDSLMGCMLETIGI